MSKKKRSIESVPLKITQEWTRKYGSSIWREIDESKSRFAESFGSWNPICMAPSEVTTYVLLGNNSKLDASLGIALQVLYSWRKFKKVYSINQELAELLMKSAEDTSVLTDCVMKLPFPAIYIEFDGWLYDNQFIGAFINFDCPFFNADLISRTVELQISLVNEENGIRVLPLVIEEGFSITDSLKHYFNLSSEEDSMSKERYAELQEDVRLASQMVQIVLYLCAVNAEITENPVQKKIYKKTDDRPKEKDVLREVEKFDVGVRIGNAIRIHNNEKARAKTEVEESEETLRSYRKGTKKRPHVRRSHFHNFWVGTGNNRHLELRFLPPSYINFSPKNEDDAFDVVKHKIVE